MSKLKISKEEFHLIQSALNGEKIDFSNDSAVVVDIRGVIIRNLLFGLPLPIKANDSKAAAICHEIAPNGICLSGAVIHGKIDLSNSSGKDGNPCPPLLLENCVLLGEGDYDDPSERAEPSLDARHSLLSRLSLKNCRVGFINLCDAKMSGDLELEGLRALKDEGQCYIDARGIFINGSVSTADSHFNLRQKKLTEPDASPFEYALNLRGAEINGNVELRPNFIADGGVNFSNVQIKGDLWANGAKLIAQENLAFSGQSACINGVVGLTCESMRYPKTVDKNSDSAQNHSISFRAEGCVSFLNSHLGALQIQGARIQKKQDEKYNGFVCISTTINQSVHMDPYRYFDEKEQEVVIPFESDHPVSFGASKVSGSFFANDAKLDSSPESKGFFGESLFVGVDFRMNNIAAKIIYLNKAKIGGLLDVTGAKSNSGAVSLDFYGIDMCVGNNLILTNIKANRVYLRGSKIAGYLASGVTAANGDSKLKEFHAQHLEVGRELWLANTETKLINISGARIDLNFHIHSDHLSSINAEEAKIGGNVIWNGVLSGKGSFRGSCIGGEFVVGNQTNPLSLLLEKNSLPEIILEDAVVSRDLKIEGITIKQNEKILLNWDDYSLIKTFSKKLDCYENWTLYEAIFESEKDKTEDFVAVSYVTNKTLQIILLDGLRKSISEINDGSKLLLETPKQVCDYLKFFCTNIWGEEGAFRIVESESEFDMFIEADVCSIERISPVAIEKITEKDAESESESEKLKEKNNFNKEVKKDSEAKVFWSAEAFVIYAQSLFKAKFRVHLNGDVEMSEDFPLIITEEQMKDEQSADSSESGKERISKTVTYSNKKSRVVYRMPYRFIYDPSDDKQNISESSGAKIQKADFPVPIDLPSSWTNLPIRNERKKEAKIVEAVKFGERKPRVNLKGFKTGSLDDNYGENWDENLILELDGFSYERFETSDSTKSYDNILKSAFNTTSKNTQPEESVSALRIKWLKKQYKNKDLRKEKFKPQPYEQVVKVLRSQGNYDDATNVLIEKLRIERKMRFSIYNLKRLVLWVADFFFGYGVRWKNVFLTFLFFLAVGTFVTDSLNNGYIRLVPIGSSNNTRIFPNVAFKPIMVTDSAPVSTIAMPDNGEEEKLNALMAKESASMSPDGKYVKEIRCGDQIEPVLYALDTFVPLLDLRQEAKCTITSEHSSWIWRLLKSIYSILGWIVTSALILTVSGVVERQIER